MLNNSDLSWIRNVIESEVDMLPGSAVINRNAGAVNSYYEYVDGFSAVGTVACRIDPFQKQDSKGMAGEREANRNWYRLTLPYGTDVQADDTITIDSQDYSVVQLHDGHSLQFVTRLVVARVE